MIRRLVHGLGALALVALANPPARAADPVIETAVAAENCECGKPGKHLFSWWWAKHSAKPKDEGYERRKEACRFAFGPSGPYLYPEKYQPLPPWMQPAP